MKHVIKEILNFKYFEITNNRYYLEYLNIMFLQLRLEFVIDILYMIYTRCI